MTALGETLRRERLRRNLQYDAISRELKISARILQAIEEEQFDKLPGGVFAKGFVRQYARLLGLDEEEAVAAAQRLLEHNQAPAFVADPSPPQQISSMDRKLSLRPVPIEVPRMDGWEHVSGRQRLSRSSTLTALALVVGVMLVCSLVYGWWQRDRHSAARPVTAASASQPKEVPPQTAANQPSATPSPSPSAAGSEPPRDDAASAAAQPMAGQETASSAQASKVSLPQVASSGPEGPVHVELTALEPVWVTAHTDGKYAFSGVIPANQTKTLDASDNAVLKIGNAGGLRISLNGKPIGDIGPRGQVRTVQFTSGGFHIVVAPKPSDPIGLL